LVVVFVEFVFVDLDGEALEGAEELAVEGDGFIAELVVDEVFDFLGPGDDDGDLLVLDELEFPGGGAVVEEEGEVFVSGVDEVGEDVFAVPAGFLLVVIFVEVGLDGGGGEWVGLVEVEDFVADAGGLGEVAFGGGVLGVEDVGLAFGGEFAFAVAASGGLGDGVEACHGAIDEGEVDIDAGFDELGGDEADGEFFGEALADGGEHLEAVLRAHEGGKVEISVAGREVFEE
jgi:hypothetical protein